MEQAVSIDFGANLILAERLRQVSCEGFQPAHDDAHDFGELAHAAVAYTIDAIGVASAMPSFDGRKDWWPFADVEWNPSPDPIRTLVKAGALIAAEIDRLQRLKLASKPPVVRVEV